MKNFSQTTKMVSPRNTRRRMYIRTLLLCVFCVGILLLGNKALHAIANVVTSPVYAIAHYFEYSSETIPVFFRDRNELLQKQRTLEAQLAAQQGIDATLEFTRKENEELKAVLGVPDDTRIAAGIVGRPPYTPYDTLILDVGSNAGIVERAPVFIENGHAIGYVRSTTQTNALVTLFSSSGVTLSVYIFGPNIYAHAVGVGGGVVRVDVPQGISIEKGNMVILPSLHSGVLGVLSDIESTPTDPDQHGFVTLGAPIASMRIVGIGTAPIEPIDFKSAEAQVDAYAQSLLIFPIPETIPTATSTTATTTSLHASSSPL